MATYAIGDIHGSFDTLVRLIDALNYDPAHDRLWFVGDLVNNGTQNVKVLRWIRAQGDRASVVLGNHDLHMLATHLDIRKRKGTDTFKDIFKASDADELIAWLSSRKMAHYDPDLDTLMVHSGVLPQWTVHKTLELAAEVEHAICENAYSFFQDMYGNHPNSWTPDLEKKERMRLTVNALTRMRVVDTMGAMNFSYKGTLKDIPPGLYPWFEAPKRCIQHTRIIFGHWSAMGYLCQDNIRAIDSGCTWGRWLTGLCLENDRVVQVPAHSKHCAFQGDLLRRYNSSNKSYKL